jgi:hypothetical protein
VLLEAKILSHNLPGGIEGNYENTNFDSQSLEAILDIFYSLKTDFGI